MTFRTRKIRKNPPYKPLKKIKQFCRCFSGVAKNTNSKQRGYLWGIILVCISAIIVFKVMTVVYNAISEFDPKDLILALGTDLKKDEHGYTNIVLLGDGGHVRDGADLIDTIMVASIDYEKKAVTILSIPRDYYVDSKHTQWSGKINELYRNNKFQIEDENERFELFQKITGEITNLNVHYYVRVDFNAFVEVIDSLGGITVDVKESIYDPYYPNETDNGYTVFEVKKGSQEMDGEKALKFVRSRKTTSDFDRAFRQQLVLGALREKAVSKEILTSASALKNIYSAINDNMNTNMALREMIELAGFAKKFDRSRLISKVIHDDPGQDGGFLYTPEKKYYNGQFVLIPFGDNLELIHKYADLIFHKREVFFDPVRIDVLNATKDSGIARNTAYQLNRFGFNINDIDNYFDSEGNKKYLEKGVIFYYKWQEDDNRNITTENQATLEALESFIKSSAMPGDKLNRGNADISIVLGDDYDEFWAK